MLNRFLDLVFANYMSERRVLRVGFAISVCKLYGRVVVLQLIVAVYVCPSLIYDVCVFAFNFRSLFLRSSCVMVVFAE